MSKLLLYTSDESHACSKLSQGCSEHGQHLRVGLKVAKSFRHGLISAFLGNVLQGCCKLNTHALVGNTKEGSATNSFKVISVFLIVTTGVVQFVKHLERISRV